MFILLRTDNQDICGALSYMEMTDFNTSMKISGSHMTLHVASISAAMLLSLLWLAVNPAPATALLLGLLAMSYVNYFIGKRDVLYPAFTFTAIWAIVVAVYYFCPFEINQIGWRTVVVVLAGHITFSIGALIGRGPFQRNIRQYSKKYERQNSDSPGTRYLLLGYTLMTIPMFLNDVQRIAGEQLSFSVKFLSDFTAQGAAVLLAGDNPYSNKFISSAVFFSVITMWVMILEEKRKWMITLSALCVCVFALISVDRGILMLVFCGCITLVLLKSKDRRLLKLVKPLSITASAIVVIMILMSLLSHSWAQGKGGLQAATYASVMYIAAPLAAFNYYLYNIDTYKDQPPEYFSQEIAVLSQYNIIQHREPASPVDKFAFVPFPTNVYTCFKSCYQDFGALGCFAAFAVFGFVQGYLFRFAIRGSHVAAFLLAYLSKALMFSSFNNYYEGYSRNLNVLAFVFVYFFIFKRLRIKL